MSKTYVSKGGDTFTSIARGELGNDSSANIIRQMNPQVSQPIEIGTPLQLPESGKNNRGFKPFGLDLKVDGVGVGTVDSFVCSIAIDGFRRAQFTIPNEVRTREICPQLNPVTVDIGYNGYPLFGGYLGSSVPQNSEKRKVLNVSALSSPNVLSAPMMINSFPIFFRKVSLDVIAQALLEPFGVGLSFLGDAGPVFSGLKLKQKQNTLDFLSKLTKQRNLVISDDADGNAVFHDGVADGEPVLDIDADVRPDVNVVPAFRPEVFYSHVCGVLKGKNKRKRKKFTVANPHYRGIIREHEFEISESDEGELETAVNSVAARMFGDVFQLQITIPGWTDKNGELLGTGKLVSIKSESNYIPNKTDLLISGVTFRKEQKTELTTLTCVIPGVYSGQIPTVVPWTLGR